MIKATCIQKFKKNNKIYGYRLQDSQGNIKDVYADQLKNAIRNQQIQVINLTLTSDNRLVDTTSVQPPQTKVQQPQISDEEQKIKNLILKSKALGLLKEIPTYCGHHCTLISKSNTDHIIYIPDDVTHLNKDGSNKTFSDNIQELQGTLRVIGGHNLKDTNCMFNECQAQSLDLTSFNTSNITYMFGMFACCQAQFIDLSSFDTSKVTNMRSMFEECQAKSLDLSSFNTSKVKNMESMFYGCQAQSLDLSSFNTSNVTDMRYMFECCQAKSLDLLSFNTSNVTNMEYMFDLCEAQIKATDPKILERI